MDIVLTYLELDIRKEQEEQQEFKMTRKEKTQFLINADRGRKKSNLPLFKFNDRWIRDLTPL